MEIIRCYENEYPALVEIWERSVKATHAFLSDEDFNKIKKALIPNYFPKVNLYALTDSERITGFIGLSSNSIEMLFIDDNYRGKGYGSALIDFALKQGATKVDVNEQNAYALNFYQARGFRIIGRDETDEAGRPYPILHLSL